MESSLQKFIIRCLTRLRREAEEWNGFLEADCKLHPNPSDTTVIEAFKRFFDSFPIMKFTEKRKLIGMMMDIYGGNHLHDLYGPNPLEDFSLERIKSYEIAVSLIQEYMDAFKSLNNPGAQKLHGAIEQDLEFITTVRSYLSLYWVKGKYKYSADLRKKELVDFCLPFKSGKGATTETQTELERLWSIVYRERASKNGGYFRSACSRAKKVKTSPQFVLKKSVSQYSE